MLPLLLELSQLWLLLLLLLLLLVLLVVVSRAGSFMLARAVSSTLLEMFKLLPPWLAGEWACAYFGGGRFPQGWGRSAFASLMAADEELDTMVERADPSPPGTLMSVIMV